MHRPIRDSVYPPDFVSEKLTEADRTFVKLRLIDRPEGWDMLYKPGITPPMENKYMDS
jgi:hypothetical protein